MSIIQQIAVVRREIERRVMVGERLVKKGTHTREEVDAKIREMEYVLDTLVSFAPEAPQQVELFLGE